MAKKKQTTILSSRRVWVVLLCTQTLLLLSLIAVTYVKLSNRIEDKAGLHQMSQLLGNAIKNITVPTYKDIDGKQYIPEARLQFNADRENELRYSYSDNEPEAGIERSIAITTEQVKNTSIQELSSQLTIEDLLTIVPSVQECTRMYIVTYSENASATYSEFKLVAKVDTGTETLYIRKNPEPLCRAAQDVATLDKLLETIKSAQAY